jgi:selenide,water dikinase
MRHPLPLAREIVLIGGGHAHALLLRRWGMVPLPGARLTVINPAATAPYTGMLPGYVAGHYDRDALEIDLVRLARFAGARMIFGTVTGIDRAAKLIHVAGRAPVAYDIASVDVGITSDMPDLPGFSEHGIAAKPLGLYARRWRTFLDAGGGPCAVIGGGVAGVELALAMRHAMGPGHAVAVIEAETALTGVGPATRRKLLDEVRAAGITLVENARVERIGAEALHLADGSPIPSRLTVGAAGARPFGWLAETGLDLHEGYIAVDAHLRTSDPAIFAAGDCAHLSHAPRPKAGVFAVRAAPVLAHNLAAAASREPLRRYRPQRSYLKLISLGDRRAVADKWGLAPSGDWVWRWKDRIDRAFMEKLSRLPRMTPPPLPLRRAEGTAEARGPKPLCGGCGAKVGADALDRALARVPGAAREDVETGTGDDAAVLRVGGARQVVTTDHLRAFWDDPYVFARISALHALGDVWAMGAAPQAALVQLTLPPLAPALQERWLAEIMAAASEVFATEDAAIVGGHTTLGAELTLGFTVTGLLEGTALALSGARAGDTLLLTRPIGSGTILAAEMAGDARGGDVEALLGVLTQSQGDAARYLAPLAHAMTDVTGFGLAGHAARMAVASGVTAVLDPGAVPVFPGALALATAGTRSSIWGANREAVPVEVGTSEPRNALLFDPQTAGGFLVSLSENAAREAVGALVEMGHEAAVVGRMEETRGMPLALA